MRNGLTNLLKIQKIYFKLFFEKKIEAREVCDCDGFVVYDLT